MNGIQEVEGSIPFRSTKFQERHFKKLVSEKKRAFVLYNNITEIHVKTELIEINAIINVQLIVLINLYTLD